MKSEAKSEIVSNRSSADGAVRILPAFEWEKLLAQTRALVPEAFNSERRILNLIGGTWQDPGYERPYRPPMTALCLVLCLLFPMRSRATQSSSRPGSRRNGRRWTSMSAGGVFSNASAI